MTGFVTVGYRWDGAVLARSATPRDALVEVHGRETLLRWALTPWAPRNSDNRYPVDDDWLNLEEHTARAAAAAEALDGINGSPEPGSS